MVEHSTVLLRQLTCHVTVRLRLPLYFLLLLLVSLNSEVCRNKSGDVRAQVSHDRGARYHAVSLGELRLGCHHS